MHGRKFLPAGTILIVMALLLATVGVGYGLWKEILVINGTVETGNVDAELSIWELDEGFFPEFNQNDRNEDNEVSYYGKDVADCNAVLSADHNTLDITITKGYPSFWCWVEFDVHNLGTIPVHVDQPIVVTSPPQREVRQEFLWCYHYSFPAPPPPQPPYLDPHPQLPSHLGLGDRVFCALGLHVEQAALQGHTYTFQYLVPVHQFNEFSTWPHDPIWP